MEERIQMGSLVKKVNNGYIVWDRNNRKFRLCEEFSVEKDNCSFLDDLLDSFDIARSYSIKIGFNYGIAVAKFYFTRLLNFFSGEVKRESSYPWF